jgi:nucleoside-diphosphate-sugar epimerase
VHVFITGATGFIGGSIAVRLVEQGHEVSGLTRKAESAATLEDLGIVPVIGTLDERDLLMREADRSDAVINAADSDHRPAVEALIDALAGSRRPLLHTSGSSIVAEDSRGELSTQIYSEQDVRTDGWEPAPDKTARVALDRLVLAAAGRGIRSAVLCNSLIYGHGRGPGRDSVQIPRLVAQARKSGVVRHIGPGRNIWSTVHIDDVVDLYMRALADAPAGSFYFVENGEASFADMASAISAALGLGPAQQWDVASAIAEWGYEPAVYALGSNSRVRGRNARTELDWTPEYNSATAWIRGEVTPG